MGFFGAVGSCYANILNFSGRARRKEYWYFFLFQILLVMAAQAALVALLMRDPALMAGFIAAMENAERADHFVFRNDQVTRWLSVWTLGYFILLWLPNLSVTIRRLHDTDRSGWWMLFPMAASIFAGIAAGVLSVFAPLPGAMVLVVVALCVPLASTIYVLVLLCLSGSHGRNRFGPDPIVGRKRTQPFHPALAGPRNPEEQRAFEAQRRAEIRELYRSRVLAGNRP